MQKKKATVFYGICGEGLGHFSRAAFLIPQLVEQGYSVEVFSSGRVADLCEKRFPDCRIHHVPGFYLHYQANKLDEVRSFFNGTCMIIKGLLASPYVARQVRTTRPVAVISDCEPVLAWVAGVLHIPVIALDHQQVATECKIVPEAAKLMGRLLLGQSNRMMYLQPDLRIITSFFKAPLLKNRAKSERLQIGSVLRPEVVRRTPTEGNHVVVYQTSRTLDWLDRILEQLPGEKHVYGAGRKQSGTAEHSFAEDSFLDDLASCRFVVVNGGHTTISEALYYGKPVLCFPILGQAEQEINAHYIAKSGYGMDYRPRQGEVPDFTEFLEREDEIRKTIVAAGRKCANDELGQIISARLSRLLAMME